MSRSQTPAKGQVRPVPPIALNGQPSELSPCWWPLVWEYRDLRPNLEWLAATELDAPEDVLEQRRRLAMSLWSERIEGLFGDEETVFFSEAERALGEAWGETFMAQESAHRDLSAAAQLIALSKPASLAPLLREFAASLLAHQEVEQEELWPKIDAALTPETVKELTLRLERRRRRAGRGSPKDARIVREAAGIPLEGDD